MPDTLASRLPAASRRRLGRGIRTRVVASTIALLLAVLVVSVVVTRQMLLTRVDARIEDELAQEIEELRVLSAGSDPATGQPFGQDADAVFRAFFASSVPSADEAFYAFVIGGRTLSSFEAPQAILADQTLVQRWTSLDAPLRLDVATADGEARTLASPMLASDGALLGTFVVAVYPAADLNEVDEVVRTLTIVSGAALLLGSLGAWLAASRILRPVRELTTAARAIDLGELDRRIDVAGHDELAELGDTFNGMLDRLDTSARAQRAFLDDVAHELRTPITIARGHLELLDADPDLRGETVAVVTEELDRMSRYVDDLLVVAKAAQPDFLQPDLVDVGDLVDDVLARAVPLGERDWTRGRAPRPGEVLLIADGSRLTQALLALVTNAVQQTEPGSRIEVGASIGAPVPPETVRLYVADTGPGVAHEDREQIFSRFSRTSTSRATRPEGTGLGLPIVAAIAEAHGGTAGVGGEPGVGATFWIDLPLTPPDEEDE